jgi:hypothetical protein
VNGVRVDSDIVFWMGPYTFIAGSTPCSGAAYVEDVGTHELGHALGLKHSDVVGATMYAYYRWCDSQQRYIESDDRLGIQALYGLAGAEEPPPPPPPPTSGPTLTARITKVKSQRYVDLSWTGLAEAWVRVYRNGVELQTTINDSEFRDSLGKGGGTVTYKVCDSVCTNTVTVSF